MTKLSLKSYHLRHIVVGAKRIKVIMIKERGRRILKLHERQYKSFENANRDIRDKQKTKPDTMFYLETLQLTSRVR